MSPVGGADEWKGESSPGGRGGQRESWGALLCDTQACPTLTLSLGPSAQL